MAKYLNMDGISAKGTSGLDDGNTTHVLLESYEYRRLLDQIEMLKTDIRMKDLEIDGKLRALEEQSNRKIQALQQKAQQELDEKDLELEEARQDAMYQKDLNETLMRINRERANSDRHLRPKREHSGYVVLRSGERDHSYRVKQKNVTVRLWETVLQTPYSIDFSADQAKEQTKELFSGSSGQWLIAKIGIHGQYSAGYAALASEEEEKFEKFRDANSVLQTWLQANYRSGYWEITLLHTKPLNVVPPEMRA